MRKEDYKTINEFIVKLKPLNYEKVDDSLCCLDCNCDCI